MPSKVLIHVKCIFEPQAKQPEPINGKRMRSGMSKEKSMKARDVMVSRSSPYRHASVKQVAKTFLERHISAVPVVDEKGKLVGIISERRLVASRGGRHRAAAFRGGCARSLA